jgi:predicted RNA binding protein with dsRBD fold (UPF0201 family)/cytidylate kinase
MKIIAFVGYPLSGKTTASKIARKMGIPVIVMGDVIREELRKRGLELTDKNAGALANELRKKEGMDAIAKRCIPKIREAAKESGVVVIDGIRGIAEVERFKNEFGDDFLLVAIHSDTDVRFERAKRRKRSDDVSTVEDLMNRDKREESWGMDEAIRAANLTIENDSDMQTFIEKVEAILMKFTKSVEVEIETRIFPTEDEDKVREAVKNFFPDAEIKISEGLLKARAKNLDTFRELLRKQRILDTARQEMLNNIFGNEITLLLNKQTATVSKINFTDEDALLSPIKITFKVYGIDIHKFIDYLAPGTRDGRPVREFEESELYED